MTAQPPEITDTPAPAGAAPSITGDATLDDAVVRVLGTSQTVDITTTGRRSGLPRRLEISLHNIDGRLLISGMPNPRRERDWLLNLRADPRLTLHLKQLIQADVPATAREITDEAERRATLIPIAAVWRRDLEPMVRYSPLIELTVPGFSGLADS